jgi:hypothetical protein
MKRLILLIAVILGIAWLFITPSCKKDKDPFDENAQKSYEAAMALQDQCCQVFNDFLATQDTAAARESLAAWFTSSEEVEWAKVSSQGVTVQYKNGICGGFIDDFQRRDGGDTLLQRAIAADPVYSGHLKNLPSHKKAVILAAFYDSWAHSVDVQKANWQGQLAADGFAPVEELRNSQVTLDKYAALTEYGIIDFNTHGVLWPDQFNTEEILLLTHESKNIETTRKYWEDMEQGKVATFSTPNFETLYGIKPEFITEHNDFKNDTVMFWGGFCYSYLGHWPEIINDCAAGAYFGVNWIFQSDWAAYWATHLITSLSDHALAAPMNVEYWMTSTPSIHKDYWMESEKKTVKLDYTGYGGLTLWKPENEGSGTIISTSADGAPINVAGFICADYVLQCLPEGQLPLNLGYEWDYGDGSSTYYTVNDNLALYHHWALPQTYHVKVSITDISTQSFLMELKVDVSFIYPDFLPQLKANPIFDAYFGPDQNIHFSGTVTGFPGFSFNTSSYDIPLTWSDSSFSSQDTDNNDYETITVEGNVSSDGTILRHCLLKKISQDQPDHELTLEITGLPILAMDPINCINTFFVDNTGNINQVYLTRVEYKEYDLNSMTWITISSIDWATAELYLQFRN